MEQLHFHVRSLLFTMCTLLRTMGTTNVQVQLAAATVLMSVALRNCVRSSPRLLNRTFSCTCRSLVQLRCETPLVTVRSEKAAQSGHARHARLHW